LAHSYLIIRVFSSTPSPPTKKKYIDQILTTKTRLLHYKVENIWPLKIIWWLH